VQPRFGELTKLPGLPSNGQLGKVFALAPEPVLVSRKKRRIHHQSLGLPAGSLVPDPEAEASKLQAYVYSKSECKVLEDCSLEEALKVQKALKGYLWLNLDGLASTKIIQAIGDHFSLPQLALEDAVSALQRSKVDYYDNNLFLILKMLHRIDGRIESEHVSFFLGSDYVLTLQENYPGDSFEVVRTRLKSDVSLVRGQGADTLAYELIDSIIDSYFPILEEVGEDLENLETQILEDPSPHSVRRIHDIKRDLLQVRRAIWPLREVLNALIRDPSPLVTESTRLYLRDCYDHLVQVTDLVETYRELGSSLMDVYLSSLSNRMNEVMKVLTIITTIFVPLTFVAGVYGMNFNPEKSPWNMPELQKYFGYPVCLAVMLMIALAELAYFKWKGWIFAGDSLKSREPGR
jgi:magnesium transporter